MSEHTLAYLGLGSNLSEPLEQLHAALSALLAMPGTKRMLSSSWYQSKPMGPQDQPDYVNAVVAVETELQPLELLSHTQGIEQAQGRVRKLERWGPRTLDIDILLFGEAVIDTPKLTVPHYGLTARDFVVIPLLELADDLRLPCGQALRSFGSTLQDSTLVPIHRPSSDWQYPAKSV